MFTRVCQLCSCIGCLFCAVSSCILEHQQGILVYVFCTGNILTYFGIENKADIKGNIDSILNNEDPGLTIIRTPINPITSAIHLLNPIVSLRKTIERIVIKKGLTKNKVTAVARDNLVKEKKYKAKVVGFGKK